MSGFQKYKIGFARTSNQDGWGRSVDGISPSIEESPHGDWAKVSDVQIDMVRLMKTINDLNNKNSQLKIKLKDLGG